jgi:hypothetical protein
MLFLLRFFAIQADLQTLPKFLDKSQFTGSQLFVANPVLLSKYQRQKNLWKMANPLVPISNATIPARLICPYLCANQADVTIDNFSLNCPKCLGSFMTTTTDFWTVDRVASGGRFIRLAASICLEQEMPKRDVAGFESVASRLRVKYEKSSVLLYSITVSQRIELMSEKGAQSPAGIEFHVRMHAVGQRHEREEGPVIFGDRVGSILAEAVLNLGASMGKSC